METGGGCGGGLNQRIRERGRHGTAGLPSDWETASLQAGALAKQYKRSYSPHSVLMWILESDHPDPWCLLRVCALEVQEEKDLKVYGASNKDHNQKFTKKFCEYARTLKHGKLVCAGCGKGSFEQLSKCQGCRVIRYCNEACQKSHWKVHKQICAKLKQRHIDERVLESETKSMKKLVKAFASKCEIETQLEDWREAELSANSTAGSSKEPVP